MTMTTKKKTKKKKKRFFEEEERFCDFWRRRHKKRIRLFSFPTLSVPVKSASLRLVWVLTRYPAKWFLRLFACGLAATMRSSRPMEMKMESYNNHSANNFSRKKGTMTQSNVKGRGKEETFLGPPGRSAPSPPRWMKTERTDMRRRFEAASAKNVETMASDEDKHVFVLVHGLGGSEDDLLALATELLDRDTNNVILRVTCNTPMRSFDGIVAGGERIVDEVEAFAEEYDAKTKGPLKKISFIGNSMGGLYCRYALTRLYERKTKTIMGMEMHTFMTTATPHLGVGEYGYFELVPGPLRKWAGEGLGQSIKDLALFDVEETTLDDEMPLLAQMTINDEENDMYFIEALSAFRRRCAFANAANDFLVSYETASLRHEKLSRKQEAEWASLNGGPTIVFDGIIKLEDRKVGGLADVQPTTPLNERMEKLVKKTGRIGNERWTKFMEHGLRSAGPWRHVDVSFPGPLPIAHNKIVALQRNSMTAKLFKEGEVIVRKQAEYLMSDLDL